MYRSVTVIPHAPTVGAAEGCDLLMLFFKSRSKDRPNAARAFGSSYRGWIFFGQKKTVHRPSAP
jgi:hypothetical protein